VVVVISRRFGRIVTTCATVAVAACLPPPMNVGYVALDPSRQGGVDLQGQFGGGASFAGPTGGGGGVAHVEPFVARKVSLPIGFGLGVAGAGGRATGLMPFRFGVRHRALRHLAWGVGIGPSIAFDSGGAQVAGVADFEIVPGVQMHRFGFSFGIRPAFSFVSGGLTFYGMFEPAFAIGLGRQTSLTLALVAGPWVSAIDGHGTASGFLGAAIGVHRRF
jgi:hypothetical protein